MILADPVMIDAYRAGVSRQRQAFPRRFQVAKIHWKATKSAEAPVPTTVPGSLDDVDFIEKDSKRFPDTHGWGYAQFNYDAASDTFAPLGSDARCGAACIESTGRFAMEFGYHVTLVTDATAAFSPELMHAAHKLNGPTYAHQILSTAELISALQAGPVAAD